LRLTHAQNCPFTGLFLVAIYTAECIVLGIRANADWVDTPAEICGQCGSPSEPASPGSENVR